MLRMTARPSAPCLQGACGPVHAVLSENMAAYHFWGVEAHRWQVASLELFDASPTTLRSASRFGAAHATLALSPRQPYMSAACGTPA
jgi:hypothetical protein